MQITFHGVRGSSPSASLKSHHYGGNTSSVTLEVPGQAPLLLDLGTGVAAFGRQLPPREPFIGQALVTHLHFDHVLGLPFFEPLNRPGGHLEIYGPPQATGGLAGAFAELIRPPYFPVELKDLLGEIEYVEVADDRFTVGTFDVLSRLVPHVGPTLGYRVEHDGRAVAYLSDHQAPPGLDTVAEGALELCVGVELLVHDAQYTPSELRAKPGWGHSSVAYALLVARQAGARRLALYHHDPGHGDDDIDRMLESVAPAAEAADIDVFAAAEGMVVDL
jgi:ribonuclease BN (tRNA processing enzyme)